MKLEIADDTSFKPINVRIETIEEFRTLWHLLNLAWGKSCYDYVHTYSDDENFDTTNVISEKLKIELFNILDDFKDDNCINIDDPDW